MRRSAAVLVIAVLLAAAAAKADDVVSPSISVLPFAPIGGVTTVTIVSVPFNQPQTENLTLTYATPEGTTFARLSTNDPEHIDCTEPAAGAAGVISCHVPALETYAVVAVTLNVAASVAPGTVITHVANNTAGMADSSATATNIARVAPSATVTASIPQAVTAGTTFRYLVTVQNDGTSEGPAVLDPELVGLAFVHDIVQVGGVPFGCIPSSCRTDSFPPGASASFVIDVWTHPAVKLRITTGAKLTYSDFGTAFDWVGDVAVVRTAALRTEVAGPNVTAVGDDVEFDVTVHDDGPSAATTGLTVSIPQGMAFASITGLNDLSPDCATPPAGSSGTIVCSFGELQPKPQGYFGTPIWNGIALHARPAMPGTISLSAHAVATDATTTGGDATFVTTVVAHPEADLQAGIAADAANVASGAPVTYVLTLTNNGISPASGAKLTVPFPPGTDVTVNDPSCGGAPLVCRPYGDPLAPGATAQWSVVARLKTIGASTIVATASSDVADPNPSNDSASVVTFVRTPVGNIVLNVAPPAGIFLPGDVIPYLVEMRNDGPDALDATLEVTPPAGTQIALLPESCSAATMPIRCGAGTIAPGDSQSLFFGLAAPRPAGRFAVTFVATTNGTDTNPTDDSVTADVQVNGYDDPSFSDIALTAPASIDIGPGGVAIVSGTVSGSAQAPFLVTMTFTSTAGLITSVSAGAAFDCRGNGTIICTDRVGNLSKDPIPWTVTLAMPAEASVSGALVVRVTSSAHDPDLSNNFARIAITNVPATFALSVAPLRQLAAVGLPVAWTISVTNQSSVSATAIVTRDPFGAFWPLSAKPSIGDCSNIWDCAIGPLAPGASATIEVAGVAWGPGRYTETVSVNGAKPATVQIDVDLFNAHQRAAGH